MFLIHAKLIENRFSRSKVQLIRVWELLTRRWNAWHWESFCVFTAGGERVKHNKTTIEHWRSLNLIRGGRVVLTCLTYRPVTFGWDDKPRSSVCTHSEHQTRTIKILQSLCVSHKIVETCRNQHAPKFSKGKMEWCANGSTDQSHLRMWHLLRTGQNIGQAPWAFDKMDMCAIKVLTQIKSKLTNVCVWCGFDPSLQH
jgi:hypothetical protein